MDCMKIKNYVKKLSIPELKELLKLEHNIMLKIDWQLREAMYFAKISLSKKLNGGN